MSETHTVTPSILNLITDYSDNFGESCRWIRFYEENGHMPDDFLNRYYAKHEEYSVARDNAAVGLCDPQPLLFN